MRTWNLFHGNTKPPERHAYLEEMVRQSRDRSDVNALRKEVDARTSAIRVARAGYYPSIVASGQGLAAINHLCEREHALLRAGIIPSDHVIVVARPREEGDGVTSLSHFSSTVA